ncbi:MAG: PAS domain S-box protein [Proteobacteria bacterium]|nr:PAS domain S-box protein [Pseudomonadota bacterium]
MSRSGVSVVSVSFQKWNDDRALSFEKPDTKSLKFLATLVVIALAYIGAVDLGLATTFENKLSSALWPASGIALAAYVIYGGRVWPAVFVGAFSPFAPYYNFSHIDAGLLISVINTAAPYLGARILRAARFDGALQTPKDVALLAIGGAAIPMALEATAGVAALFLTGFVSGADALPVWWTWWVGDAVGILVVSPLLFTWRATPRSGGNALYLLEVVAAFLSLALISMYSTDSGPAALLAYMPIVLWCILRLSQRENAIAVLLVAAIVAWKTIDPARATHSLNADLTSLVTFVGVLSITALMGGAAMTKRQKLEDERLRDSMNRLAESESRFRNAFDSAAIGMAIVSLEGRWLRVNATLCKMLGYRTEEFLAADFQGITHPDDVLRDVANAKLMVEGLLKDYCVEKRYLRKDGAIVWVILSASLVRSADGAPLHFVSQIQDITARKQADMRLRSIVESSPSPCAISDGERNINYINQAFRKVFGWELDEIRTFENWSQKLFPAGFDLAKFERDRRMLTGDSGTQRVAPSIEMDLVAKDGGLRHTIAAMTLLPNSATGERIISLQDITELRATHDQLRESQKMEAFGRLASGIAHDFNNLLGVVYASAELLQDRECRQQDAQTSARLILRACERGADLTRRLLIFSRRSNSRPEPLNVMHMMDDLITVLRRTLGGQFNVSVSANCDDLFVFADATQFHTALYNIAINARDAMPAGGSLSFKVERQVGGLAQQSPRDIAVISISDDGMGMSPDVMRQVFEPFFTTKEAGRGTGLGLSMVYGFVKETEGDIRVDSKVGKGTTFTMRLPAIAVPQRAFKSDVQPPQAAGGYNILLVEDDEDLRSATTLQLQAMGHAVRAASSTAEALALVEEYGDFQILLTDFRLSETMTGAALARIVQARLPGIATIVMSGYLHPEDARQLDQRWALIEKPFAREDLVRALHHH